jgi:hypothetical protein
MMRVFAFIYITVTVVMQINNLKKVLVIVYFSICQHMDKVL